MKSIQMTLFYIFLTTQLLLNLSEGCSCVLPTVATTCKNTVQFVARIKNAVISNNKPDTETPGRYWDDKTYKVEIVKCFKHQRCKAGDEIYVSTNRYGSLCGYPLKPNQEYVVMSHSDPAGKKVKIGLCEYNKKWEEVSDEEKKNLENLEDFCEKEKQKMVVPPGRGSRWHRKPPPAASPGAGFYLSAYLSHTR